jgi:F0F1-type ATP synthase membrane subunit b/b'
MTIFLAILAVVFLGLFFVWFIKSKRLEQLVAQRDAEIVTVRNEAQAELTEAQTLVDQQLAEVKQEAERTRQHYEVEARRVYEETTAALAERTRQLESLRRFEALAKEEEELRHALAAALKEVTVLKTEAQALVEIARNAADGQRKEAVQRAQEIRRQAENLLNQATRDAGRIVAEASQRAEQIGGDAYTALRDKELLEQAVKAIRNVVDGYGDRYIIPTRSLLDELAADFGHTEAGQALAAAREHSRRMVEQGQAAGCDYTEANRRTTAIRFVVDAFNGRVDAILSRAKHDNCGTLEQEIRDAFSLVNLNGKAFREARLLPTYLDARLAELKWAVVAQELRHKEREEQRALKERIREEEKARREYEKAMQEAQREEELIKQAMEKARAEAQRASAEDRSKFEAQIALLSQQLTAAEAKNQRALSMAQQTRAGHVYIISNVGSFGGDVFKIGLTRRLEPLDRIKELGDASVPFEFDIHAMIRSNDAPALEKLLHHEFDDMRINKVNFRKEFFRVPLNRVRELVLSKGLETSFTMLAESREYRETQAIERMTSEERQRYYNRHEDEDGGTE